ncbi:MAG TPA: GTPase Era [Candidatus Ozemobacteraceae bacterium]|nr:GTPase Era [Candidatus Ozemobacteraceae bacterium]HQG27997.1 GTPase Era [Candidatus Ozemobacteraceae bacterium]
MSEGNKETRFGAVGVFGRANAGKSTLVNALVGEKVSIVSKRPQTTRRRILGILTEGVSQVVFCDTPGLHAIKNRLDAFMAREIEATAEGLQGALYLVDLTDISPEEDAAHLKDLLAWLGSDVPLYLVLTKLDERKKADPDGVAKEYAAFASFAGTFSVSAEKGTGLGRLKKAVFDVLVPSPHAYDGELFTSQTEREIAEETIREVILEKYYHEVPHSVAVLVEQFKERENGKTFIEAHLVIERESHRKILLGHEGEGIKAIGSLARERLNGILGRDIYLQLWIKVRPNWRKQDAWVRNLGYRDR